MRKDSTCSVSWCKKPVRAHGLCTNHYRTERRSGRLIVAPPCSTPGCDRQAETRGLCPAHYKRMRRRGLREISDLERVLFRIKLPLDVNNDCWIWQGALWPKTGYGKSRTKKAHRVVYDLFFGSTKSPLHHRCHNRRCVNPKHLEPMSASEHAALHNSIRRALTSRTIPREALEPGHL